MTSRPEALTAPPAEAVAATRLTRTKIIATVGPASESEETIQAMVLAGMDCARLNFSHGDHDQYSRVIRLIREVSERLDRPVAIMQDLQGPRIRLGLIEGGSVELEAGDRVELRAAEGKGTREVLTTTYRELPQDVGPGDRILLDDGRLVLAVEDVFGEGVHARVVEGGLLKEKKGINLPGVMISTPALTEKDVRDIRFGCEHKVDYVALSFVRRGEDLVGLKETIRACNSDTPVIAKLEKPQAVENLDEILQQAAGVMIARGDLGVELPPERVPGLQKAIIRRANASKKLVIVATQMLESMTASLRPTRAEASDVANAIYDGADAVMLSAETATGRYPVQTVAMMERITAAAEVEMETTTPWQPVHPTEIVPDFAEAVCDASTLVAAEVGAKYIVAFTQSGATAALLAKYRPSVPLIAFTPYPHVRNRLALHWGVTPLQMEIPDTIDRLIRETERRLVKRGLAVPGEVIVLVCGAPLDVGGRTNLMKIHRIGDRPRLGQGRR